VDFFAKIARSAPYLLVTSWVLRLIAQILYSTLKIEYRGIKSLPSPCIIALWHNKLLLAPLLPSCFKNTIFAVVASKSRDGLLLGAFAKTYQKVHVIHVGHQSRQAALLEIVDELQNSTVVIITPDGPRGPLYEVKGGIAFSAQKSGASIVSMQWHASRTWKLSTWDKLEIPKPFSKVVVTFKEPISIPAECSIIDAQNLIKTTLLS
jgi:lysophospholipid acyltransferase (LPLAT)-like uncharacterized protein